MLGTNPLLQLRKKKDGSISDHDSAVVAHTMLSAQDVRISELERRNALLEKKNSLLNGPMFAATAKQSDDGAAPPEKHGWFARYLTLRNFGMALVVVISGVWTFFTWYTADKSAQLNDANNKATAADRRAELAEKSKAQIESDIAHWKKNSDDLKKDATELDKKIAQKDSDISKEKARADTLALQLDAAQKEKNRLIDSLGKAAKNP